MLLAIIVLQFTLPIPPVKPLAVRDAVAAAVPQLVAGAKGHAEQKACFACHNQAYPMLALIAARDRGFVVPEKFVATQVEHVTSFLATNKDRYRDGRGTGGQAATASFALLTLELAGYKPDETTDAVADYLVKFEPTRDHWRTNSNRPPTESSDFTTTYVTMRVLRTYGVNSDQQLISKRVASAKEWLRKTSAQDTEDRVFRLMGLKEAGAGQQEIGAAAWELLRTQKHGGGWSQIDGTTSDAYATGSALYALHYAGGLSVESPAYRAGIGYLLKNQLPDGSWHVMSRSKPFQPYYESGFPHEKNQFISIAATGWATAALAAVATK